MVVCILQADKCKTVYLRRQPNPRKKILVTEGLEPPNPKVVDLS
jgi:hypothetical protein